MPTSLVRSLRYNHDTITRTYFKQDYTTATKKTKRGRVVASVLTRVMLERMNIPFMTARIRACQKELRGYSILRRQHHV